MVAQAFCSIVAIFKLYQFVPKMSRFCVAGRHSSTAGKFVYLIFFVPFEFSCIDYYNDKT